MTHVRRTVTLFGIDVDAMTMDDTVDACLALARGRSHGHHVCVNAAKLVAAVRDPRMRRSLQYAAIVSADGQSVVWAARILGARLPERVAGIDLMGQLLAAAAREGLGVYFLGAREDVLDQAVTRLVGEHRGLRVVGRHHGYFEPSDEDWICADIRRASPDIVFLAISSPMKERWVETHRRDMGGALLVGVGGSIDVAAGITSRAPRWLQRLGFEWAYRLAQEPSRLAGRYLKTNTLFVVYLLNDWLHRRLCGRSRWEARTASSPPRQPYADRRCE